MIKWFFIYKWLELKEFVQEHQVPIFIIGTVIVSALLWSIPLSQTNQTPFQIVCLSALLGVGAMMVLGAGLALAMWVKRIVKDNIEKAKTAIGYDVSKLECEKCDGGIKLVPPPRSIQNPFYKCLKCGYTSHICHAEKRQP